jgi:hypothetical protein
MTPDLRKKIRFASHNSGSSHTTAKNIFGLVRNRAIPDTSMIITFAMMRQMPHTFTSRSELISLVIRLIMRPSLVLS